MWGFGREVEWREGRGEEEDENEGCGCVRTACCGCDEVLGVYFWLRPLSNAPLVFDGVGGGGWIGFIVVAGTGMGAACVVLYAKVLMGAGLVSKTLVC